MIDKEELLHRDKTIRSFINAKDWDRNPEFLLVKDVINDLGNRRPELKDCKYIYDYEWEVKYGETHEGKGDLIFTDGMDDYLIVECKNKDSHEVRRQVLKYIRIFRKKTPESNKIIGLTVTPKTWDLITEDMGFWNIELNENDDLFYELFTDLTDPSEIVLRDKLQELYKNIGYYPTNPINALNELRDKIILSTIEYIKPTSVNPPFTYEIKVKVLKDLPEKEYNAKHTDYEKKTLVKALTAAKICDQIYLPYHMKEWTYPITYAKKKKKEKKLNNITNNNY
ncbi:MAG: hypothetical protein ACTSRI_12400 [Promethearchaeota archaeon]